MVCSVCVCHLLSSFGFAASVVLSSFFSSDLFAAALEDFFVGLYTNGAASALRATFGDDEFGTNAETFVESFLGVVGVVATFGNGGILFGFGIFLLIGAGGNGGESSPLF